MKLLSWNIRGGLKASGWDYLFVLLKKHSMDLVLLVETHLDDVNSILCIKRFGNSWEGDYVPGNGRSRGIILVWKRNFYKVSNLFCCNQAIHVSVSYKNSKPWLLTGLYASNSKEERLLLWELLGSINTENLPWLVWEIIIVLPSRKRR
ncbi:hypothetical protein Cni_G25464 [Canna indica]|uniref:Endonuclease/exonuclease/phosphatase domain-containing protein n=1 Tax=Canna indica TaxID=4628 RepID=A0AAQ3L1X3_9LILI|nr:hypothetical protein Cni_G25464 [Canna indica]